MDEVEGFPVPFVMNDFVGHLDAKVGGDCMVDEVGSTSGGEMELLRTLSKMYFRHGPVVASDGDGGSLGHVGHEPIVLELENFFANRDYLELTDGLGVGEILVKQGSKTGLVELTTEDGELATHEHLVHTVAPEEIDGR